MSFQNDFAVPSLWSALLFCGLGAVQLLQRSSYGYWNAQRFDRLYLILAASAALAENSSILLYGQYAYSETAGWGVFVGKVPVHVCLIWPQFIFGMLHFLRSLHVAGVLDLRSPTAMVICFVDTVILAFWIEVCCVDAGLWAWTYGNCLGVPLLGLVGWALFCCGVVWVLVAQFGGELLSKTGSTHDAVSASTAAKLVAIPFLVLHAGLLVCWFGLGFQLLASQRPRDFTSAGTAVSVSAVNAACKMVVVQIPLAYIIPREKLPLRPEFPRMLGCAIIIVLWAFKGQSVPLGDVAVISAALLVSGPVLFDVRGFVEELTTPPKVPKGRKATPSTPRGRSKTPQRKGSRSPAPKKRS